MSIFEVTVHLLLDRGADSLHQRGRPGDGLLVFRVRQRGRTDVLQARAGGTGVLLAPLGAARVSGDRGQLRRRGGNRTPVHAHLAVRVSLLQERQQLCPFLLEEHLDARVQAVALQVQRGRDGRGAALRRLRRRGGRLGRGLRRGLRGLRDRRSLRSVLGGQKVRGRGLRRLRRPDVLALPLGRVMEGGLRRGERGGQRRLVGREGGLEVGRGGEGRRVREGRRGGRGLGRRERGLFEGGLLRRAAPVHVDAVLGPLRPAVVRVVKLALVSARFVTAAAAATAATAAATAAAAAAALSPTGLVRRRGLPTGEIGVLGEGRAGLPRGVRGSLGQRRVLPQAGVARLVGQGRRGAAGGQRSSGGGRAALRQPADRLASLPWGGEKKGARSSKHLQTPNTQDIGATVQQRSREKYLEEFRQMGKNSIFLGLFKSN